MVWALLALTLSVCIGSNYQNVVHGRRVDRAYEIEQGILVLLMSIFITLAVIDQIV